MNPISPTIGRIVLFAAIAGVVLPAMVTKVHSATTVDLVVFGAETGTASIKTSATYDHDTPDGFNATTRTIGTWAWMPYQMAQAAKHEGAAVPSLEAACAGAVYAFMGWLTTREAASGPFSSSNDASSAAELAGAFVIAQGWDNTNPAIPTWKNPDETDAEYAARLDREHPLDSPENCYEIPKETV